MVCRASCLMLGKLRVCTLKCVRSRISVAAPASKRSCDLASLYGFLRPVGPSRSLDDYSRMLSQHPKP